MRKLILLAVFACLLAPSTPAQTSRPRRTQSGPVGAASAPRAAEATAATAATFASLPFATGETLSYSIDWNGSVTAARMELSVAERGRFFGQDGIRLTADVHTVGLVRSFAAAVDAHYDSYSNPRNLLTFRADRDVNVNGKTNKGSTTFDRAKGTATSGGAPATVAADTADPIALFYRIRALPLRDGDTYTLDGYENNRRVQVRASVEGRESVSTPSGQYNAIRVAFLPLVNGAPSDRDQIRIYYSDNAAHLPVLMTAEPEVGPIRIALASVKGGR